MPVSTRSAKPQRQSQHATRRAERPSQKPGKENADPKVSNAVTSSRPSKVKRIVDSCSTDERDNKDAPDSDLVARVARVGVGQERCGTTPRRTLYCAHKTDRRIA